MSTEVIKVIIHDDDWPEIMCSVSSSNGVIQRSSLYDTAGSNFEPHVLNALRAAVIGIIQQRRTNNGQTVSSKEKSSRTNEVEVQGGKTPQRSRRSKSKVQPAGNSHRPGKRTKGRPKLGV